jgi:hypothetical protein
VTERRGLRPLQTLVTGWRPAEGGPPEPVDAAIMAWSAIVGPRVAQHSQPLELNDGTLIVATRSSAWSQQLQFLEPQILERLRTAGVAAVTQLRFRSGRLRRPAGGTGSRFTAGRPAGRRAAAPEGASEPAPDVETALARARRRIADAANAAERRCADCGAPSGGERCAPCDGARERTRRTDLERLLYAMPWLGADELRALVPGLRADELDAARRGLLQRWWTMLERTRRSAGRATPHERRIASSYVLLQSGLAPEAVTPAVMRNVLGADLEARLYGSPGSTPSASNETGR